VRMFLGSIAGIWILIFLILAQRGGYSRRFRLGVTLGVALNLMVQLTYQYPQAPDHDGAAGDEGADASASVADAGDANATATGLETDDAE